MPEQKKAAAPAPTPPRATLIMDAPTNSMVASYLVDKGYSVEVVRDLKYCSTNLLKTSKFIFLGPDEENSAFYSKIKATLKKMVPDRLFEESGQELIESLKTKIVDTVQPHSKAHPQDPALEAEKRKAEDEAELAKIKATKPSPPVGPSDSLKKLLQKTDQREFNPDSISSLSSQITKSEDSASGIPVNEKLASELKKYTDVLSAIGKLNCEKELLVEDEDIPEDISTELAKITSQLSKPLSTDRVLAKAKVNEEKAKAAAESGKPYPPRKLPEGEMYDRAIDLVLSVDSLVTAKSRMRYDMADFFASNICRDKHYKIFKSIGVDANYLYGTLYFHMALTTYREQSYTTFKAKAKEYASMTEGQDTGKKKSGIGGLFKKKEEEATVVEVPPEQLKLAKEIMDLGCMISQLDKDLSTFEVELCNGFWSIYEELCYIILIDKVKNNTFLRYIRSFLRFGLISEYKGMINESQKNAIFAACKESKSEFIHEEGSTNIIYPDESLLQMAKGNIPYSFDEELELNGQGTPAYKYDKAVRKIFASDFKIKIYTREISKWQSKIDKQSEAVKASEELLGEQEKGTKEYKVIQTSMREAKAEMSRVTKIVEKFQEMIDKEQEIVDVQNETIKGISYNVDLKEKASIEAKSIRKFCKLLSNLKENFFPFLLRDNYKVESNNLFTRKVTTDVVLGHEENDPFIYTTDLANAQNPRKQVLIRYSPLYQILPCMGTMGFCVAPSNSQDTGRFVSPLMSAQQIPLERMIIDISADFRYDTAKENAGMDLMTSDTICAAYAKVRWDYRKKGKEFREKAGIYNDMQDKKNFKVHYRLYMESMDESGKKLFFKCNEMYEGFVKYIPLPKGKEKLSRN